MCVNVPPVRARDHAGATTKTRILLCSCKQNTNFFGQFFLANFSLFSNNENILSLFFQVLPSHQTVPGCVLTGYKITIISQG